MEETLFSRLYLQLMTIGEGWNIDRLVNLDLHFPSPLSLSPSLPQRTSDHYRLHPDQPPSPFSSHWGTTPWDIWTTSLGGLVTWSGQSTFFLVNVIVLDLEVLIFIPAPSPSAANYPWASCQSLFDNANRTTLSAKRRDKDLGTIWFMLCSTLPSQWVDWTMYNADPLLLNDR